MAEYIWIIQIVVTVAVGCLGWFARTLYGRIQAMEGRLQDTRENYVHKDDILVMKDELITRLNRIEDLFLHLLKKRET